MIEKLKIIASEQIISFERHSEERFSKLAQIIKRDGKLRNPLLAYPLDGKYLILDDATILMVLRHHGAIHVPVQLADVEEITVRPWQRVVEKLTPDDILGLCRNFPRQIRVEKNMSGGINPNQIEIRFREGDRIRLTFPSKSYLVRADLCSRFFDYLALNHKSYRAKLDYKNPNTLKGFPGAVAAVFPPAFALPELAGLATREIYLPQGIARIDQPNRLLGIDYPVSILGENVPPREKELFLRQLLAMRLSSDRVAYYNGGVFMFNN